jgi:mannose-1-phosphate guanylyltransferase
MDAGWSDVGTWSSLKDISQKDDSGNVLQGDVVTNKLTNSYVRSEQKLVAVMGLDDVIIVDTKDATLVSHQSELDNLKLLLQNLEQGRRQELEVHAEVYRPWGKYETVDRGEGYQVKRITVKPGGKLSLQKHHQRAEHWVVVSGKATVTRDDAQFTLVKNESTYIPIDTIRSLENNEDELLEIIEVQSGDYLGEDDIVRYSDHYGRI